MPNPEVCTVGIFTSPNLPSPARLSRSVLERVRLQHVRREPGINHCTVSLIAMGDRVR
jgi:hypothetical protein